MLEFLVPVQCMYVCMCVCMYVCVCIDRLEVTPTNPLYVYTVKYIVTIIPAGRTNKGRVDYISTVT